MSLLENPETEPKPKLKLKLKVKQQTIECQVCIERVADQFRCINCNATFCKECFYNEFWSKPQCMKCNVELNLVSLQGWMGGLQFDKLIVNNYLYKNIEREETTMLEFTVMYMDWIKYTELKKRYTRWGSQMVARGFVVNETLEGFSLNGLTSEEAERTVANYKFFKCSCCEGVVVYGICKKCHLCHCSKCQRIKKEDHQCLMEDLASIVYIKTATKPCPSCNAPTAKNGGCDHMHCRKCDTHYFWSTGLIVDGKQFTRPIDDREGKIYLTIEESRARTAEVAFKKLLSSIQSFNENNFGREILGNKYNLDLLKLRIKFLKNEVTQDKWIQRALAINVQYRGNLEIYDTINSFIRLSLEAGVAGAVGSSGVFGSTKAGEQVPFIKFA